VNRRAGAARKRRINAAQSPSTQTRAIPRLEIVELASRFAGCTTPEIRHPNTDHDRGRVRLRFSSRAIVGNAQIRASVRQTIVAGEIGNYRTIASRAARSRRTSTLFQPHFGVTGTQRSSHVRSGWREPQGRDLGVLRPFVIPKAS
jgi:hypothetical protein